MTPYVLLAGALTQTDVEFARPPGDEGDVILKYAEAEKAGDATGSYAVSVEPWRLSGAVRRTEHGWVAVAAMLGALGYGDTPEDALEDLLDAVEQYLEFLRDDQPTLAPAIAHHAAYVALLGVARGAWLASVIVDASPLK